MDIEPLVEKLRAFNWNVIEIDGHDFEQILTAFDEAELVKGKPTFIVAHTVKGKGVSFMEDNHEWHGKAPNDDETKLALAELEAQLNELLSQKVEVK
jgi:transketolase